MIESPTTEMPRIAEQYHLPPWTQGVTGRPAGPRGPATPTPSGARHDALAESGLLGEAKWAWACRFLQRDNLSVDSKDFEPPRAGDLALFRIGSIGYHASVVMADNSKLRIYPGDAMVGVFGHRYATDAYEAQADCLVDLSVLTAGGMVGRILSRHREMGKSTTVSFLGYVVDSEGERVNLKDRQFQPATETPVPRNLIVVVGTGMNAGKTTVASQLIHVLGRQGLRVAALKVTGSVSNRDSDEMRAAGAVDVRDFSEYGFPSTFLAEAGELRQLWGTMLSDSERVCPDVTIVEIADGILQRETEMILGDPEFRGRVRGVVLASNSALGALAAVDRLQHAGYPVVGVSGAFTSAPLYVREYARHGRVPVASSAGDGAELGQLVRPRLELRQGETPAGRPAVHDDTDESVPTGPSA